MSKFINNEKNIIIHMDGGLASQMLAYSFGLSIQEKGYNPYYDLSWFKRFGRDKLLLNKIYKIDIPECANLSKYRIYNSGNLMALIIRKSRFINLGIMTRMIPKIYYTVKPFYMGKRFSIDDIDDILKNNKEVYFWGYWSFSDFIEKNKTLIQKTFEFPKLAKYRNCELLDKICSTNSVSIHVRRGDYLNHQKVYNNLSLNYYRKSIEYIENHVDSPVFFVFSDDIEWCKDNSDGMGLPHHNTIYVSGNIGDDAYLDMILMASCKNNIVANSGFSLWAGFLNENGEKIVIAPKEYFTEEWCRKSDVNLYRIPDKNWILINN